VAQIPIFIEKWRTRIPLLQWREKYNLLRHDKKTIAKQATHLSLINFIKTNTRINRHPVIIIIIIVIVVVENPGVTPSVSTEFCLNSTPVYALIQLLSISFCRITFDILRL